MAAHELRTPLAVVVGYLSMLADGTFGDLTPDWGRVLQILAQKGEELNSLVDGLLTAARIDAGTVGGRPVECDLREVARRALHRATPQAELLGAELHLDLPDHPVFVQADPNHVARIVENLVNNALAYSRGRPWLRLAVRGHREAVLTVEDRGVGIPLDARERVFEQFVRLDSTEEPLQPGTGLGLYISRELARRHGGELSVVESEPGRGSTLALRLKLVRPTPEPSPAG
jgi:signal transduction histidine kinase